MVAFIRKNHAQPGSGEIRLKSYTFVFSLSRLRTGIDNIRYDVRLSEIFCNAVRNMVFHLMNRKIGAEIIPPGEDHSAEIPDKEDFKRLCREFMLNVVNKAKQENEPEVDTLAQAAIIRFLLEEIRKQHEKTTDRLRNYIRRFEVANQSGKAASAKKTLGEMDLKRDEIVADIGKEVFRYLEEGQNPEVNEMRRINFGERAVVPEDFLLNPMLCVSNPSDDTFMLKQYRILLGHRVEDPDKYENLILFIQDILENILCRQNSSGSSCSASDPASGDGTCDEAYFEKNIGGWLKRKENVDILFNCFQSEFQCRTLNKNRTMADDAESMKNLAREQKKNLQLLYRKFRKAGMLKRIIAAYEMQPVYLDYCPPLVPQLILEYFTSFRSRRSVTHRVRKLNRFHGKSFSLLPLRKVRRKMWIVGNSNKKGYLLRFLKDMSRYHRDRRNWEMVKETTESVNLLTEERKYNLSKANFCLYEFLLPHEQSSEEKPVINHVIIKADVRGSTDITHRMMKQNLNPASYFSLNFFDPITEILPEYGAEKVFVEGDAIILSIFERKDSPEGWYSVARACGLAARILSIVRQCNDRNHKNSLPIIELGLGISYNDKCPTFLFDGDHRIMISSAINLADRLSGCSKLVRKQMLKQKKPFNLYVFQLLSDEAMNKTSDDLFHRYNVNGIELNAGGFEKLCTEIDLKPVNVGIKALEKYRVCFYTGEFPTVTRSSQRLIIRESRIPRVSENNFSVLSLTRKKYYEVCTNPKLHEYVDKITKQS